MQAYRCETKIDESGQLRLSRLPFRANGRRRRHIQRSSGGEDFVKGRRREDAFAPFEEMIDVGSLQAVDDLRGQPAEPTLEKTDQHRELARADADLLATTSGGADDARNGGWSRDANPFFGASASGKPRPAPQTMLSTRSVSLAPGSVRLPE